MKRVLWGSFLVLLIINYSVDFAFYLKDRYCRYHIGRWETEDWKKAVEKRAIRWLKKTPVVKITDNSRYILLDIVTGKYRSHTIQSWQKAALLLGLFESGNNASVSAAKQAVASLLDADGNWKISPTRVDCGMLSYAVMRTTDDPSAVKTAMDSEKVLNKDLLKLRMALYMFPCGERTITSSTTRTK